MIKTMTVFLMVLGLVMVSTFSNAYNSEGPTVIIVGYEKPKKEIPQEQETENSDQNPIEENNQVEEYPDETVDEDENPDEGYMEEEEEQDDNDNEEEPQ